MAYRAMLELADLYHQSGDHDQSTIWERRAAELKSKTNELLWNNDKGFYHIHDHVNFPRHKNFAESNIFAMGGNAVAIRSGLATSEQSKRIVEEAIRRQTLFNVSTISGTLLPSYPEGFFQHPALDGYFEYQNGGQWDWFGGRLILAMYKLGMEGSTEELLKIARKTILHRGFYEWDTVDGRGRGSTNYTRNAGVLGHAVIEGLFGVEWNHDNVLIMPCLGQYEGYLYLPQPSTNEFVSYHYKPIDQTKLLLLRINSNIRAGVRLRIPNPFVKMVAKEVRVNGEAVMFDRFTERFVHGVELKRLSGSNIVEVTYQHSS